MYSFLDGESGLETVAKGVVVAGTVGVATAAVVAAAPAVGAGVIVATVVEAVGGVSQLVLGAATGAGGLFTFVRSVFKKEKKKK